MRMRKEYFFLLAVILGLCVFLFFDTTNEVNYRLPEIPSVKAKNITKLEILSPDPDHNVALKREGENWFLEPHKYKADIHKVRNMLGRIEDMELTALASESDNYERYDLSEDKKIRLRVWEGDDLAIALDIGKTASTHRHTFVKLQEDPDIYQADGNLKDSFDRKVRELRDKTVLAFDKEDLERIEIFKEDGSLKLQRKKIPKEKASAEKGAEKEAASDAQEGLWVTESGKEMKDSEMEELLNVLHDLRCKEYIHGKSREDFSDPAFRISLAGNQQGYELSIFPGTDEEENTYPALSSQSKTPFYLDQSTAEQIMTKPDQDS